MAAGKSSSAWSPKRLLSLIVSLALFIFDLNLALRAVQEELKRRTGVDCGRREEGTMMTNTFTVNPTSPGSFPLPIFIGIAFALSVAMVIVFCRRNGKPN